MPQRRLRVLSWNLEWATPRSTRGRLLRERIDSLGADIVCLTETSEALIGDVGHVVTAGADWGYRAAAGRRKALWNRRPWTMVDAVGVAELPPGRFIAGTTETPLGAVDCFGVCIPWHEAHVRTGQSNRRRWEDHLAYLSGLAKTIGPRPPALVLGDFNQTMPRTRAPLPVHAALTTLLDGRLAVATANLRDGQGRLAIDHIAHSQALAVARVEAVSSVDGGRSLSDHFGVLADLVLAA